MAEPSIDVESIIKKYIPKNFRVEIFAGYPKPLEYSSIVLPRYDEENKLCGCLIKLDYQTFNNRILFLKELFHELYHTKEMAKMAGMSKNEVEKMLKKSNFIEELKAEIFSIYNTSKHLIKNLLKKQS